MSRWFQLLCDDYLQISKPPGWQRCQLWWSRWKIDQAGEKLWKGKIVLNTERWNICVTPKKISQHYKNREHHQRYPVTHVYKWWYQPFATFRIEYVQQQSEDSGSSFQIQPNTLFKIFVSNFFRKKNSWEKVLPLTLKWKFKFFLEWCLSWVQKYKARRENCGGVQRLLWPWWMQWRRSSLVQ